MRAVLKTIEAYVREGFRALISPAALRSLQKGAASCSSIEEQVALVLGFRFLGIKIAPLQVPSEITALLKLLAQNPPRCMLEVGTAKGGTFFLFARVAAADATLVSVDLPGWPLGAGYAPWRAGFYRSFGGPGQKVATVLADSHSPDTLKQVQTLLPGRPVDLLFIDGDHSYEGVRRDFELYSPLVRAGGLIGFHDIVPGAFEGVGDVPRFWEELKHRHHVQEFVADWSQRGAGIGLLTKETETGSAVAP